MRIEPTAIDGIAILHWALATDDRGSFGRTYCREELAAAGLRFEPVQANVTRNPARHTLRGLHFQAAPHAEPKIVSCARGRIWDAAVDVRPGSPTFGRWLGFELGPESERSLYLGDGIAHGFLTLEPDSDVHYLMGAEHVPGAAAGVRWDDPALAIDWPAAPAIMSDRDRGLPLLEATGG